VTEGLLDDELGPGRQPGGAEALSQGGESGGGHGEVEEPLGPSGGGPEGAEVAVRPDRDEVEASCEGRETAGFETGREKLLIASSAWLRNRSSLQSIGATPMMSPCSGSSPSTSRL